MQIIIQFSHSTNFTADGKRYNDSSIVNLVSKIVHCFGIQPLSSVALSVLVDVSENDAEFLHLSRDTLLSSITSSKHAEELIGRLKDGDYDEDGINYVHFLVNIVQSIDLTSSNYVQSGRLDTVLSHLLLLLDCPGPAMVEDVICQRIIEAFNDVSEGFSAWDSDRDSDSDSRNLDEKVKALLLQVCGKCAQKVSYPKSELNNRTRTWDVDDRGRFQYFRNDVRDFLQSAFTSLGRSLVVEMASSLHSTSGEHLWLNFESRLFCLGAFTDAMASSNEDFDGIIVAVLNSTAWRSITDGTLAAPDRVRQGAIQFLAELPEFLQRHKQYLVPTLTFFFSALQNTASQEAASKAIHTLCYAQRATLVDALPDFLKVVPKVRVKLQASGRARVYGAVAAIIQALPSENQKLDALLQIQESLQADYADDREDFESFRGRRSATTYFVFSPSSRSYWKRLENAWRRYRSGKRRSQHRQRRRLLVSWSGTGLSKLSGKRSSADAH